MGQLMNDLTTAREQESLAGRNVSATEYELQQAQARLSEATRNGYKTVAKWTAQVEELEPALAQARAEHKRAGERMDAATQALDSVRNARWEERLERMRDAVCVEPGVVLEGQHSSFRGWRSGTWTVRQVTETGERVFGHEVTVYGPVVRERWSEEGQQLVDSWEMSQVNWGSLGSVRSAEARELLAIHQLGVELAEFLDRQAEEWFAEDEND